MLITQFYSWPTINWPSTIPATQYTILQVYPGVQTVVDSVATNSTTITYDDSQNLVFQVRPSSGPLGDPTSYGPEVAVFVVGYVPCRAWLRQKIRQSLSDRTDVVKATINWPDDELNGYIQEALTELNVMFPIDNTVSIPLQSPTIDTHGNTAGVRAYPLPADFFAVKNVEFVSLDGKLHLYLKEKPWRGGESTGTSYIGYPKLGILLSPLAGRFYPGNYFIFNDQLVLDWDPANNGDYLNLNYLARRPLPGSDSEMMMVKPEDMELLSLRTQMKCWLRVESQDTRLSRWRTAKEDGKRDDMPTIKHSDVIKKLYNELVNDRRELRVHSRRLVRR